MTQITTEMKYTYFIILTTTMYFLTVECASPDIYLEGRLRTKTDVLQLTCSTSMAVQLCTVEILINKRTHDSIRYYNNNCYHSKALCAPTVCMCSDDCTSFTLNVTVTQDMKNHLYSCVSKIEKEGVTYFANISVIHDGVGGLKLYNKFIVPHGSASHTQQATTTSSPEITTVSFHLEPFSIATAAFGFLTVVLLVIGICQRRHSNSKTETRAEISSISYQKTASNMENIAETRAEISSISYPKTASNIENIADDDRPKSFEAVVDGDQYGFSEQHTKTGEAKFRAFDPDTHLVQKILFSKQHSQSDSGISSIPNTRFRHMPLEKDEDRLEFHAEGQRFRLHPRCSYADSGISTISNTRSHQMQSDGETSFIFLEKPYKSIPEVVEPRNIGDSTSYYAQEVSRSSPTETTSLLDCELSRAILEKHNSCNILLIQGSDV